MELGGAVSTQPADELNGHRLPSRDEVRARGKPFPPYEDMVIQGLTDDEEDAFLRAIAEA